eukprot:TRINITY_DN1228_c0_g2_i2.p2 TRINITY_DN1228_c0_g2~~TRINITY_DN1228_c0_g2_i2.p2  ORF type:complete len:770 (-),score=336.91 TRINITY_DN1228_c0_g2_i2:187-2424(-)
MATMTRQLLAITSALGAAEAIKVGTIQRGGQADSEALSKNPIRKVVTLLENLSKKVSAEGEEEKELYEKFACYCKTGSSDLQASISGNNAKVPQVQSDIEAAESSVAQLKLDLKQHQADRAAAKTAMAEATAIREKEHEKYAAESGELKTYVDSLARAVPAIMNGMAGTRDQAAAQLQLGTGLASAIRKAAASDLSLTEDDRQSVVAFIGNGQESGYIPASTEVLGILKTMKEDFEGNLAELTATEEEAVKLHDNLIAAKTKEVNALTEAIEKKTQRVGDLGVEIVQMKADLTESEKMLIEDQKFLADLDKDCAGKKAEFEERIQIRAEELKAIHETIAILNDDDALELFKKTLPSSSFLQLDSGREAVKARALKALRPRSSALIQGVRPEIRFLEMAIQGKNVDFTKVIKMIDDMIMLLAQEQVDDDAKREYCQIQIDQVEDKAKDLKKNKEDVETSIEDRTETIASLSEELKTLRSEVAELDKLVMEASTQRKAENEEYTELMSENSAAKELLEFAKNRLQKFYNPKLYKPAAKQELTEEEQIAVNMGGTAPPTPAPGGIAGSGVEVLAQRSEGGEKPGPKPVTWDGDYKKKGEETSGVVSMIDLLIRDLTKEMTVAETEEENAQKQYENFMDDSAGKRAKMNKSIGIKEGSKADTEELKVQEEGELKETTSQLQAVLMYEQQVHAECDWLLQNYDLRKTARAEESDNLKQAKSILKGADFGGAAGSASLVEVRATKKFLGNF